MSPDTKWDAALKQEIEDIIYRRVGVEEKGIWRISILTVNLLKVAELLKKDMDAEISIYKRDAGSNKEDTIIAVRRHRDVKLLVDRWNNFWKEMYDYAA